MRTTLKIDHRTWNIIRFSLGSIINFPVSILVTFCIALSSFGAIFAPLAAAQSVTIAPPVLREPLQARITGPADVPVGKIALFDAAQSTGITEDTQIRWYLNDNRQPISQSSQAAYTSLSEGDTSVRLVLRRPVGTLWQESSTTFRLTSFNRKVVLIADNSVPLYKVNLHSKAASEQGIFVRAIQPRSARLADGGDQSNLATIIRDQAENLANAESIIIWTDGITGIQSLMQAAELQPSILDVIRGIPIILFTDRGLQTIARTVRGPFSVLEPESIIVTRSEAINPLWQAVDTVDFTNQLIQNEIGLQVVDRAAVRVLPWNLVSSLVNFMLVRGVASSTVLLLLILPIIATIIAFLKQVVGISTLGLYTSK